MRSSPCNSFFWGHSLFMSSNCSQADGRRGTVADVSGTTESPPDPIKYALADTTGRKRIEALTDSQAEGRGFESTFPLHTQSLATQGVPHGLLHSLSTRS